MHDEWLIHTASMYQNRARVPWSRDPHVVLLLLGNGDWIPGVRIDSASFQLSIPATVNAVTTAYALGRLDIEALYSSRALSDTEVLYLRGAFAGRSAKTASSRLAQFSDSPLPAPGAEVSPSGDRDRAADARSMIAGARHVAERAHVPSSNFPVGCLLAAEDGTAIPGVNVEHPEWTWILCAERNALSTMVSYGLAEPATLALSCLKDDQGTPCGACRQLIVELAPGASVWMDRGNRPPDCMEAVSMLPHFFTGRALTPD